MSNPGRIIVDCRSHASEMSKQATLSGFFKSSGSGFEAGVKRKREDPIDAPSPKPAVVPAVRAPATKSAPKHAPAADGVGGCKAAYAKMRTMGIPDAEYFDQSIGWATLQDGRELLLGVEAWHVDVTVKPPSFSKVGQLPRGNDRFSPMPGRDLLASVARNGRAATAICLHSLPGTVPIAELPLPIPSGSVSAADFAYSGAAYVHHIAATLTSVLLVTSRWAFVLTVPMDSPSAASFSHVIDLSAAGTRLGSELAFPPVPPKKSSSSFGYYSEPAQLVQCAALWEGPTAGSKAPERTEGTGASAASSPTAAPVLHLLLGNKGRVGGWRGREHSVPHPAAPPAPPNPFPPVTLQSSFRSCQASCLHHLRPRASSPCMTSCGSATRQRARGSAAWPCGTGRAAKATSS